MPTRSRARVPLRRRRAFTLIEMLLVLALLALLSALVAPQMGRWAAATAQRQGVQSVRQQLEAWSQQAFLSGRAIDWPPPEEASAQGAAALSASAEAADPAAQARPSPAAWAPALQLPEGWQLRAKPPLRVAANGMLEQCDRLLLTDADGRTVADWHCEGPALRLTDRAPQDDEDSPRP